MIVCNFDKHLMLECCNFMIESFVSFSKLTGMAFRVPVQDVSVVDLTCRLDKEVSVSQLH